MPDLNNQPVPVGQETQKAPGPKNFKTLITLLIIFGAIILFAGGYFALAYFQNIWPFASPAPSPILTESPSYFPSPSETPSNYPTSSETQSPSPSTPPGTYPLDVKWNDKLIKDETRCPDPNSCQRDYYIAGEILNGEFKGENLYLKAEGTMGGYDFTHVVFKNNQEIQADIKNLPDITTLPKEIDFPNSRYKLEKGYISEFFSEVGTTTRIFNNDILGDAYLTENTGCIVFELLDHTAVSYDFVLPFLNDSGLLDFKFINGEQNEEEYELGFYGYRCLIGQAVSEQDLKPTERLVLAGTTQDGEDFYKIKDQNDPVLQELYNNKDTAAYYYDTGGASSGKNKYTYEQFISYNPYLYWKGPIGKWIEFTNKRFSMMAEMAKPVIYFYPESKTKLEVKLNPNGGLTYAEPEYGHGWEIEVNPDGQITDLKTGDSYKYLFWEGLGIQYPDINQGWVLEKANIAAFLSRKLPYLGLNEKEIDEFKDYWVPRLSEKPYYKISFLSKFQFDQLAPLDISPVQPKTLIRIMMTAKGLDRKIDLPEQKLIKAPQRAGFTVVEWGGALLK